jgi:hypothetical protein
MARLSVIPMKKRSSTAAKNKSSGLLQLWSPPGGRILWTRLVVAAGFFVAIFLSEHLWLTSRNYPLMPVLPGLPQIPYPFDYACLAVMGALLVAIASASKPKIYITAFLALVLVLALLDQLRWQPWAYQYAIMLATLAVFYWKGGRYEDETATLNICRLIIASIYFYSGLQKLNSTFAAHIFPELFGGWPLLNSIAPTLAKLPPIMEASIGVGLLTRKLRNFAVVAAILMHLFILMEYGPFGYNHNTVVWPWNFAMIAFDLILFWKTDFSFGDVPWKNPFAFQKVVLLLVLILPALSFFGWWDSYLSWSLYSGNVDAANIFCSDDVAAQLPEHLRKYVTHLPNSNNRLTIGDWTMGELNIPGYPESRIYRRLGAEMCRLTNNSPDLALYIRRKTTLLGGGETVRDTCFGTLVTR